MKKKIIGILVCMLIIATTVLPVVGTMNISKNQEEESTIESDNSQNSNPVLSYPKPAATPPAWIIWLCNLGLNGDWNFWSNSPHIYSITEGNVGIGTTNPGYKLDVNGDIFVKGTEGFDDLGDTAIVHFGHPGHSIRGEYGTGVVIGAYAAPDALTIHELTGRVGIGTMSPSEKLTVCGGNLLIEKADGTDLVELGQGLDYSEGFDVTSSTEIEPGTVLIIDPDNPGKLAVSNSLYDRKVAGIITGARGLDSAVRVGAGQFDYNVALAGRVYCNVDATTDEIKPGDLLTTSSTPGYAMKVTNYNLAQGAILGKAMESIEKGEKGQILVLVTLQ